MNTVIFCIGKGFTLQAGQEHRVLHNFSHNSQFKFMHDGDGEIFLRYSKDRGLKTNKGGLKHMKVGTKTVDLYATNNPEHCPLRVTTKYLSLLPKDHACAAFYLQPRRKFFGKSWFLNIPVGMNCLRNTIKHV